MKNLKSIIVMALTAGLIMSSCTKDLHLIHGVGDIKTETLDLEDFHKIKTEGVSNVHITYGETQEVIAVGHGNIIDRIKTDVVNGKWNVRLQGGPYGNYELEYYITLPRIEKIENAGTGLITVEEFINQDYLDIKLEGLGGFYGFNMPVDDCHISIQGAAECEVTVLENLDVKIEGIGKVYYKGSPKLTQDISGLGSIINID